MLPEGTRNRILKMRCRRSGYVSLSEAVEASEVIVGKDGVRFTERAFVGGIHGDASSSANAGYAPPIMEEQDLKETFLAAEEAAGPVGDDESLLADVSATLGVARTPGVCANPAVRTRSILIAVYPPSSGVSLCASSVG